MEQAEKLRKACMRQETAENLDELLWTAMKEMEPETFRTAKGLDFTYQIRGNEMFVSRKDKSITRSTVSYAFHQALEVQEREGMVSGPKKLGAFGASYLYPVFLRLGIITRTSLPVLDVF